jgi:glycosyltransferase involved in cell wall biosynthesis
VKLAFVVQRYGADIAGGSEAHCRQLALHLASRHDITVLTSCARDYVTWANAFPPGESMDAGVRVLRFPVTRQRQLAEFGDISDEVFDGGAPHERQEAWFAANGPDTPGLIDHLRRHGGQYDLVLFWTYRYAPSHFGLPLVAPRAILVPTAEEDPAIDLEILREFFARPAGYIFLTPEERTLIANRLDGELPPSTIIGSGLDEPRESPSRTALAPLAIPEQYVLYLGRVDRNKGCDTLLDYFQQYAVTRPDVTLILAGPAKMQIPPHPQIRALGYVADDVRAALLAHAAALIVPSPYESLSIVLLEAWNHGVPALVNAECRVLRGQVERANGGLAYRSAGEFREGLEYLLRHPDKRAAFGRQGLAYVEREYRWPTVLARAEDLLRRVHDAPGGAQTDRPHHPPPKFAG